MRSPFTPAARGLRRGLAATACGLGLVAIAASCGADNVEAPAPAVSASDLQQCRSFDQLMPRFVKAISTGQTEGLRRVIRDHLLVPDRPGDPPPVSDVLRAVFFTLTSFAKLPPEPGAPAGQTCVPPGGAATVPAVSQANPLCEMRRAMDSLIHQGKGVEALKLVDPLIAGVVSYVIGGFAERGRREGWGAWSQTPHYDDVAKRVGDMCAQNGVCQLSDGLDLVIGLTAYIETPDGKAMLDRANAMVGNPALQPFLTNNGAQYGGEAGVVALVKVVITTVMGMNDPAELDSLPIDQLPAALQPDLRALVGDMKKVLDPKREPNVLKPLKKALNCLNVQDPNADLVRMIYRLALDAKLPEFGLTRLAGTLKGVRETDQRGTLVHLARTLAQAIRNDEQAIDSAAAVCRTLFSTRTPSGQSRSNAELALPVVGELFSQGVAAEAICAMDTLVYGCAGGAQPACGVP